MAWLAKHRVLRELIGHFLAVLATAVGALSALAIAAMWVPNWMLSPCFA